MTEDRMITTVVVAAIGLAVCLLIGVFAYGFIALFGFYEVHYRCHEGVKQERVEVFRRMWGGWESVDGDPAGGCP